MMKDHIFIWITKTLEDQDNLSSIYFSTCTFKHIHFYNMKASPSWFNKTHYNIVKAHLEVF